MSNQIAETCLRAYVDARQDDWHHHLAASGIQVILLLGLVAELLVGAGQVDDRRVIRWAEPLGPLQVRLRFLLQGGLLPQTPAVLSAMAVRDC
eukprot:3788323-Pyramimonas_sp.AAC.2